MSNYKRLTKKDRRKLEFYRKVKKNFKKHSLRCLLIFATGAVMTVSLIMLYRNVYGNQIASEGVQSVPTNSSQGVTATLTDGLNELSKNEIETVEPKKSDKVQKENKNSQDVKLHDFTEWNKSCDKTMLVVNKDNVIPEKFTVATKSCHGKEIAVEAFDSLNKMISDAKKDNINLWISSGYRNTALQTKLFNRRVEKEKAVADISDEEAERRAAKVVAKPGTSEHNTGLAVDFNGVKDDFYKTAEYKWLCANAHKYGFIERYTEPCKNKTAVIAEPWHFRYVGEKNAEKIKKSGLCLEEYVEKNFK